MTSFLQKGTPLHGKVVEWKQWLSFKAAALSHASPVITSANGLVLHACIRFKQSMSGSVFRDIDILQHQRTIEKFILHECNSVAAYWYLFQNCIRRRQGIIPTASVSYLGGTPKVDYIFHPQYNMSIVLINDVHVKGICAPGRPNCSLVTDFIRQTCEESIEPIDVFIEEDYKLRGSYQKQAAGNTYLGDLQSIMVDIDAEHPYVRTHLVDLRWNGHQSTGNIWTFYLDMVSIWYSLSEYDDDVDGMNEDVASELKEKIDLWFYKFDDYKWSFADALIAELQHPVMLKQLNSIGDDLLAMRIVNFAKEGIRKELPTKTSLHISLMPFLITPVSEWTGKLFFKARSLLKHFVTAGCFVMDCYCLSRLFRSFNCQRDTRKHCQNIRNAIIFAGGQHLLHYHTFLSQLGFTTVVATKPMDGWVKESGAQINTDVSGIPQPLFG